MTKTTNTLWTPGQATDRSAVPLTAQDLRAFGHLADRSGDLSLGVHCSLCGQNLTGQNAPTDATWSMACGCRTFTGANPRQVGH